MFIIIIIITFFVPLEPRGGLMLWFHVRMVVCYVCFPCFFVVVFFLGSLYLSVVVFRLSWRDLTGLGVWLFDGLMRALVRFGFVCFVVVVSFKMF